MFQVDTPWSPRRWESVTEGHPDKVADQISDACVRQDPHARWACIARSTRPPRPTGPAGRSGATPAPSLSDVALCALSDEALIAVLADARANGDATACRRALGVLAFGHRRYISRRVGLKVPPGDVEDVTAEILASAIRSAFDGRSVGEFVNWLDTISRRQVAQFYRRRPRELPVASCASRDADRRQIEPATDGETGIVEIIDAAIASWPGSISGGIRVLLPGGERGQRERMF